MNILIVEGKEDVAFITYLIQYLHLDNIDVTKFTIDELGGFNEDALTKKLSNVLGSIKKNPQKNPIEKIGIIIDLDLDTDENGGGYDRRLNAVNRAIQKAFSVDTFNLSKVNNLVEIPVDEYITIEIACHLIGVGGKGELEDVLREMKKRDSPHADCLDSWNCCLDKKGIDRKTDKEINKLWIHYYLKYDAFCSYSNSKKTKDRYCKLENIFSNLKNVENPREGEVFDKNVSLELFDFEKEGFIELNELKAFLEMFK